VHLSMFCWCVRPDDEKFSAPGPSRMNLRISSITHKLWVLHLAGLHGCFFLTGPHQVLSRLALTLRLRNLTARLNHPCGGGKTDA